MGGEGYAAVFAVILMIVFFMGILPVWGLVGALVTKNYAAMVVFIIWTTPMLSGIIYGMRKFVQHIKAKRGELND